MISLSKYIVPKKLEKIFYFLVIFNILYIIFLVLIVPFRYYSPLLPYYEKINSAKYADLQMANYVNNYPKKLLLGKTLISRQGSFSYYSQKEYISLEDPKMIKFYESKTIDEAKNILRNLGITHYISPDYPIPPLYNSLLPKLLSDLNFTKLVKRHNGYSFYSFHYKKSRKNIARYKSSDNWIISKTLTGGRSSPLNNDSDQSEVVSYDNSENNEPVWLVEGESRLSYLYELPRRKKQVKDYHQIYALDGKVIINGKLEVYALIYHSQKGLIREEPVWLGLGDNRKVSLGGQFLLNPNESYKLAVKLAKNASFKIVKLDTFSTKDNSGTKSVVIAKNLAYQENGNFLLKGSNSSFTFNTTNDTKIPKFVIKTISGYGPLMVSAFSSCEGDFLQYAYGGNRYLPKFILNFLIGIMESFRQENSAYFINNSEPQDLELTFGDIKSKDTKLALSDKKVNCTHDLKVLSTFERKDSEIKFSNILMDGKKI